MPLDVAQRLRGRPVDDPLRALVEGERRVDREARLRTASPERCEKVGECGLEAARAEVRRVDLDEKRPQSAHGVPRARGCLPERLPRGGRALRLGGGAQRVRDSGEMLDGAVVEVGRDPPPFVVRRLDGADEQCLSLCLAPAEPPVEAPRQRHLDEPEEDEAPEHERGERHPDAAPGRRDGAPALVGLEQEWRAVGRADRQVDLVEVALTALVAVLGAREVGQGRVRGSRPQHVELFRLEREPRADEARLVRVHDPPVARPELDTDHPLAEHALLDDPVDRGDRLGLAAEEARRHRRLDDPLSGQRGELPCVAEGLGVPEAAQREQRSRPEHREDREPGDGELGDGVPHPECGGPTTKVPLWPGPARRHPPRRRTVESRRDTR